MALWDKTRLTVYATGAAGAVGLVFAALGLADFDHATGMIDFRPFNIYALAALAPTLVAPAVAFIALYLGWGKKPEPEE